MTYSTMLESHIALNVSTEQEKEWEQHRVLKKGVVVEDGVIGHRRYANLARSLDVPYSLGNIMSGKQATHEAHRGALGQSPKQQRSQKQQTLGGKHAPIEWI